MNLRIIIAITTCTPVLELKCSTCGELVMLLTQQNAYSLTAAAGGIYFSVAISVNARILLGIKK